MAIVIATVLALGAGMFYAAMAVSSEQDDTQPDDTDNNGGCMMIWFLVGILAGRW